jgi:hypothetical protein
MRIAGWAIEPIGSEKGEKGEGQKAWRRKAWQEPIRR